MDTDGSNVICVTPEGDVYNNYAAANIGFDGDRVIYNLYRMPEGGRGYYDGLYSVNTNGTGLICLAEYEGVYGGVVYYSVIDYDYDGYKQYLYKVNSDSGNAECITPNGFGWVMLDITDCDGSERLLTNENVMYDVFVPSSGMFDYCY